MAKTFAGAKERLKDDMVACVRKSRQALLTELQSLARRQDELLASQLACILESAAGDLEEANGSVPEAPPEALAGPPATARPTWWGTGGFKRPAGDTSVVKEKHAQDSDVAAPAPALRSSGVLKEGSGGIQEASGRDGCSSEPIEGTLVALEVATTGRRLSHEPPTPTRRGGCGLETEPPTPTRGIADGGDDAADALAPELPMSSQSSVLSDQQRPPLGRSKAKKATARVDGEAEGQPDSPVVCKPSRRKISRLGLNSETASNASNDAWETRSVVSEASNARDSRAMIATPTDIAPLVHASRRSKKGSTTESALEKLKARGILTKPEIWDMWQDAIFEEHLHAHAEPANGYGRSRSDLSWQENWNRMKALKSGDHVKDAGCLQRFIARPSSPRKLLWDLLSVLLLSYDLLVIPMGAFDIEHTDLIAFMSWVTTVFWTLDIVQSLTVGYHDVGVVEMRPRKIAWHYLTTWFVMDLVLMTADWSYQISNMVEDQSSDQPRGSESGLLRMGKSVRLMRLLRLMRMMRLWKVVTLINQFRDTVASESLTTSVQISKMVAGIALVNHFVACGWYAIAVDATLTYPEYAGNWVAFLGPESDRSIMYQYSSALHWSLTQFTPASMEVTPKNAYERFYTILVIIFALVVFSTLISTITQGMTHLRNLNLKRTEERENVRRYIYDKQISLELGNRIRSFLANHQNGIKMYIHEDDVPGLKSMPEILRVELHSEVYTPLLTPHPFFFHYSQGDEMGIVNICHYMMSERTLTTGKELFLPAEECFHMYFMTAGHAHYYLGAEQVDCGSVSEGEHFCEMVLWLPWRHLGRLVAARHCELVTLEARTFRTMLSQMKLARSCGLYAQFYVDKLQETQTSRSEIITDIWFNFDVAQELAQRAFEGTAFLGEGGRSVSSSPGGSRIRTVSSMFQRFASRGRMATGDSNASLRRPRSFVMSQSRN